MKSCLLKLVLLLFFCNVSNAQEHKNILYFSPLRLLDPYNPGIELGFERMLSKKHSLALSGTYLNEFFQYVNADDLNGFKVAIEYRYYFGDAAKKIRFFVSGNAVYNYSSYTSKFDYVEITNPFSTIVTLPVNYQRQSATINLNAGLQWLMASKWVLKLSLGPGVRFNTVTAENIPDEAVYERYRPGHFTLIRYIEGRNNIPNFQYQLTLGYRF